MLDCLAVGLGGFLGSVMRYLIGKIPFKNPTVFPIHTFLINVIGAFIIGMIVAFVTKGKSIDPRFILFLKTGICGGFTTFSTFSLEANVLLKNGDTVLAFLYIIGSVVLGIGAVFLADYIVN